MKKRQGLYLFLAVFWIIFVLGGYYYFHKPISLGMVAAPIRGLIDVLFALAVAGLAGGLGRKVLRAEAVPALERAVLHYALGIGMISLLWLVLGVAGLYRFPLAVPLLVAGLLVLYREVRGWYASFRSLGEVWQRSTRFERFLGIACGVLLLYQLFVALAPPLKWDALTYHLQLPRQYLEAGYLTFVPYNPYWGHPQVAEMLYTFAMSFRGAETAAVTGWSMGVIFLVGLFGFTNQQWARMQNRETVTHSAGWMAVAAVMAGQTFRHMLTWSYTDVFSAFFGLAALIALFAWLDTQKSHWFLWTGVFAGLAMSAKWTSGVLFLGIYLAVLWSWKSTPRSFKTLLLGGLAAFLVTSPWLVKNLLVTGNPITPYVFATPWLDSARMASANTPPSDAVLWQHLLLPFSTTWAGVDSAPGFGADLGPLLLLFGLPGFWFYRRELKTRMLAVFLIPVVLFMGVISLRLGHLLQTRVYYVLLPGVAAVCGWGWEELRSKVVSGVRLGRIFSAVVILVFVLILWQESDWFARLSPARYFIGQFSRTEYLENGLGFYARAMQTVDELPETSKTLFLWEPRGFYAPFNTQADLWIDRWRTDRRELNDPDAILQRWKAEGFTHLLVYQQGVELIRPADGAQPSEDWVVFQAALNRLPELQSIGGVYTLYELE